MNEDMRSTQLFLKVQELREAIGILTLGDVLRGICPRHGYHVYVIKDGNGNVLYVGQTIKGVSNRVEYHCRYAWWSRIFHAINDNYPSSKGWPVDIFSAESKRSLDELEIEMIRSLRPTLNVAHNRRGRAA